MLKTLFTGHHWIRLQDTTSTNTYALNLLGENPLEGTLITAEFQSMGRGQKGNTWAAPPETNLLLSLIYYPRFLDLSKLFILSKSICLGVQDTIQAFLPAANVKIKWPNDLLIDQKKVAGILIENQLEGSTLKACVVGIGLNVNQQNFAPALENTATSMRRHSADMLSREDVLQRMLEKIEARYLQLKNGQQAQIDRDYYDNLYGYQEAIHLEDEDGAFEGMIVGVNPQGKLAVQRDQKLRYYDFKEVRFLL
ncbi:MAG: biotin--[acetyl-CoA-carboxylase] ligase [Bacteroidota bacterium]